MLDLDHAITPRALTTALTAPQRHKKKYDLTFCLRSCFPPPFFSQTFTFIFIFTFILLHFVLPSSYSSRRLTKTSLQPFTTNLHTASPNTIPKIANMLDIIIIALRAVQALFAIIVLGLTGHSTPHLPPSLSLSTPYLAPIMRYNKTQLTNPLPHQSPPSAPPPPPTASWSSPPSGRS